MVLHGRVPGVVGPVGEPVGVEDPPERAHSARVMRARAAAEELQRKEAEAAFARWKKRGLLAGAFLIGAGGALVKMVELLVQLLAK